MTDSTPATAAHHRFDPLSWVIGFATGLALGIVIAAWAFIFTVH